jgi:PAS domain S-box-containing protein
MKRKKRLVWKLSAVVVVIMALSIVLSGYLVNIICAHYSLESARTFLAFNSESIIRGIKELMLHRSNEAIGRLLSDIAGDSDEYGNVRFVAHHSGRIAASRLEGDVQALGIENRACAVCHAHDDPTSVGVGPKDTLIDLPGGGRLLAVTTPIVNEEGCRNAACHIHAEGPPILGVLTTEYSLGRMDAFVSSRRILIAVTVAVSLLLGTVALWLMFRCQLGKPIDNLILGTKRISDGDLDFRFDADRRDEIGVLEESFNTMTQRIRKHQSELRRAMEYLEAIVENSPDIIITVNPEGLIQTFNRGAEQILGFKRKEIVGTEVEALFANRRERDIAVELLKESDSVKNYEARFLTKKGEVRNVFLTLSRLRDRKGNSIGTLGISKDITREKKLLRDLMQSKKFAAIGQAVTGIQHAIKNMLNALKGGAYLVRSGMKKGKRERIDEGWVMVEEGIGRISDLSHNMLKYAKEWNLELERVDLDGMVSRIYELNRQSATGRGVTLRADLVGGHPHVMCDPNLIHMALMDILSNAIDACVWKTYPVHVEPEVLLKNYLERAAGLFVVEVRDNGCGMTEEIRKNVFTPFFSTKKKWGTGLGLALTSRVINSHGGRVSVKSEPGEGSVFRIHLPIDSPMKNRETADGQEGSHS